MKKGKGPDSGGDRVRTAGRNSGDAGRKGVTDLATGLSNGTDTAEAIEGTISKTTGDTICRTLSRSRR